MSVQLSYSAIFKHECLLSSHKCSHSVTARHTTQADMTKHIFAIQKHRFFFPLLSTTDNEQTIVSYSSHREV